MAQRIEDFQWNPEAPGPEAVAAPERRDPSDARVGDWIGGVLLPVFVPLVGFIAGIVYVMKGGEKRLVGLMCIAISIATFLYWYSVLSTSEPGPGGVPSY